MCSKPSSSKIGFLTEPPATNLVTVGRNQCILDYSQRRLRHAKEALKEAEESISMDEDL